MGANLRFSLPLASKHAILPSRRSPHDVSPRANMTNGPFGRSVRDSLPRCELASGELAST
jgi:hypothetical protein